MMEYPKWFKPVVALLILVGGILPLLAYPWMHTGIPTIETTAAAYHPIPVIHQVAAVVSGFGFKPLHMLLSVFLAWILLRQKASDLKTLGWGLLIFFASETACAVNYIIFNHTSNLAEYLHSFGMVVAFGFAAFALQEGIDDRLVKFSAPNKRCAFLDVCQVCIKHNQVPCKARRIFQLVTSMLAALAFLPLTAQPTYTSYNTHILGTAYHYCRVLLFQYYEIRYLPITILLLCSLALLVLQLKKDEPAPLLARLFVAVAVGAFSFSFFRLALSLIFQEALVWADLWEEVTELMFVTGVAVILWVYREGLQIT